jgi:Na+-driven multidrug efflux pump
MASMAWSSAVNTRVGNELGAGNAVAARLAFTTGVAAVVLVQACITLGLLFGARQVLSLLTNNKEVDELTRQVFPFVLPTFLGKHVWSTGAAAEYIAAPSMRPERKLLTCLQCPAAAEWQSLDLLYICC